MLNEINTGLEAGQSYEAPSHDLVPNKSYKKETTEERTCLI